MSVQAGTWNLDGEPVNRGFLFSISRSVAEYGPDGETSYFDDHVGMLYRPFHTTAESRLERQPYMSLNGNVMTWDGRLDNRDELIPQLCHELKDDHTDVAIVAAAFDCWGTNCFTKIIGDWGISIWNPHKRELILARDYIGVRHLFYYRRSKTIIWCNHLAAFALSGDQFALCDEYIAGYLSDQPGADLTPYQAVYSVPPGKFVKLRSGKSLTHTYWNFDPKVRTRYKTDAEYEHQYRHLFRQAVHRRLRTDSPILADLSGGFDSSCIVGMADVILTQERGERQPVDTFSYYDSAEPGHDDLYYITKVEEKRGKTGYHVDLQSFGDAFSFEYPLFVARPRLIINNIKNALSDTLQRHHYRVSLSGEAGDDVNGQGLDPRIPMADLLLQFRVVELAKQLATWSLLIRKRPWIQLFLQTLLQVMPVSLRVRFTRRATVDPWINYRFAVKHRMSIRQIDIVGRPWFVRPSARETMHMLVSLGSRMTHTEPSVIDVRYPYLDKNLVEFLTTIPFDQLLRPGHRRSLMKRALADILPPEVLTRTTKACSERSFAVVLEKHWSKVESIFNYPVSSRLGYLKREVVREGLLAMRNGKVPAESWRFLKVLGLEPWLRDAAARNVIFIPSPSPSTVGANLAESKA